jgi:hypothetical protein
MKQYSFKYAEPSVNNISTFCQVAVSLNDISFMIMTSRLQLRNPIVFFTNDN